MRAILISINTVFLLILSSAYKGAYVRQYQAQGFRNTLKLNAHAAPFDSPEALQDMVDRLHLYFYDIEFLCSIWRAIEKLKSNIGLGKEKETFTPRKYWFYWNSNVGHL